MKKLRSLHIIRSVDAAQGGMIQAVVQTIENLPENQTLEVLSLDDLNDECVKNFKGIVHAVGSSKGNYGYSSNLVSWIKKNAHNFDVAVIHGLWTHASIGGWLGCKASNLPYVIFPHGMLDPWFKVTYPLKHLKKQIFWYLQGKVLRDAKEVLFTCEEEKRLAQGVFWGYEYTPRVVAFGAPDVPANINKNKGLDEIIPQLNGKPFLLFLSRIHEKKGCDLLIQGFAQATKREDLQLVIAGPCEDNLIDKLKSLAQYLGIEDKVHWPGMLRGEDKASVLYQADAFILISHQENFGIAVAEALANSQAVLISNKINIWKEIFDGNGGIISADTVDGAAEVIEKWENLTQEEKVVMKINARKVYEKHFTVQVATAHLTDVLTRVSSAK